ncbi:MAG: hypothetical protein ACXVFT_16975 [Solirubrobacteraceae bacterium]
MSPAARGRASAALVAASAVLLVAATLVGYARRVVFDSAQFADRATAAVRDPRVRDTAAERVTDGLVLARRPDLLAARPLIVGAVSGIVGGGAFAGLFHRAALDAHRAVFAGDEDTLTLTLLDAGTVTAAALEKVRPGLAAQLNRSERIVLLQRRLGAATAALGRWGDRTRALIWVLVALTIATAAGALALSRDRRRTVVRLGVGVAGAGLAILAAYAIGRALVLGGVADPAGRAATGAVWDAFLGDLRHFGWMLAAVGAIVAAAAASLIQPVAIDPPLRAAWRAVAREPHTPALRLLRAGALIAAGVLVVAAPATALQVAATIAGIYLVAKGVESGLRVVAGTRAPAAQRQARRRPRVRRGAVAALATALVAAAVAVFAAGGGADAPAPVPITRCNGHAALCDRPLDEVVLPATHNSMSAPLPGWLSAEQERSIGGQLADGVRGLLLDTHYADRLKNGRVRTVVDTRAAAQDSVSPEAEAAALRLRERLGYRGAGVRGMYLCHGFCELGATPLATGLKDVHDFLVTRPGDVVVVINQDYVTPADFVRAIGDAGLADYAFTPPPAGSRWPTLRRLIERDQRLVVLAENHAGAAPWYQLAYARLTEETPFLFTRPALLTDPAALPASCADNRGPARAPLFLINHWVTTTPVPRPSDAAKVNAYDPLLARARECERRRHHLPTLLAVNFYKEGDLFRVVDTLNGITKPRAG